MANRTDWTALAPRLIYNAYPGSDLLSIAPPSSDMRIGRFKEQAEDAGDTLFLFLCREADDDCLGADEYLRRLDRAIKDIEHVRDAVEEWFLTKNRLSLPPAHAPK